jgi:hypothetical protein
LETPNAIQKRASVRHFSECIEYDFTCINEDVADWSISDNGSCYGIRSSAEQNQWDGREDQDDVVKVAVMECHLSMMDIVPLGDTKRQGGGPRNDGPEREYMAKGRRSENGM